MGTRTKNITPTNKSAAKSSPIKKSASGRVGVPAGGLAPIPAGSSARVPAGGWAGVPVVEGLAPISGKQEVIVGVDTHKYFHVVAVMDMLGVVLEMFTITADGEGFQQLLAKTLGYGVIACAGVEGTGSYGSSLASFLRSHDIKVVEVNRPNRKTRYMDGKSDTIDAINAARAVLSHTADSVPKHADGKVEMIRQLKVAHDGAVKAQSAAMISLKSMIIYAPDGLKKNLLTATRAKLIKYCSNLEINALDSRDDSLALTLKTLALRWQYLETEIKQLYGHIAILVQQANPLLTQNIGIGVLTAADILIVAGDNPDRITSEAAFAKMAGISPLPASSGLTSGKYRINHGGNRQLNSAIFRVVICRMRTHEATEKYVAKKLSEGKTKKDAIRCLKRYLIRSIYRQLISTHKQPQQLAEPISA